jgi:hypothetical protein
MIPLPGSAIVNAGQAGPSAASAFLVSHQLTPTYTPIVRAVNGGAIDLGALER